LDGPDIRQSQNTEAIKLSNLRFNLVSCFFSSFHYIKNFTSLDIMKVNTAFVATTALLAANAVALPTNAKDGIIIRREPEPDPAPEPRTK
jgi:hypothetical protein